MKLKTLALALGFSVLSFNASAAADLSKETEAYKKFVVEQIDLLLADTEKFADYLKKGDLENAKKVYAVARMYYERSEPIAESFGDLDPRIDARLADLTAEVEIGKIYNGTVLKILEFGAIVQVLPGRDGLLHVSQIAQERVNKVEDYVKEGQSVRVKVIEADDKGRLRLSMKAVAAEEANQSGEGA